ncbi:Transposable element tcb2 transposase [Caligus rogercresseyi]|uniref:Transposable element tcb2 transposase n=1 Tax=Caligus rogercresseyi TaxID=217165 RepID=A0A7T8JZG8_CALRO|nr:Transposable element tcb2 transposase [Caligus rogercresseyi]
MEQTRRDTVIELLCAGHHPAAIIKLLKYPRRTVYDITKKWEKSGMTKRKEHKPRSDRICTPTFVPGVKRSIKANPGTPMSILARKRPQDCRHSLDGLCGLRDPVHIPAGLGARPQGQTCAVLAEEECAQLLGLQHLNPPEPRSEPMRLLLVGEVGEGGVRLTTQQYEGLHQVGDEQTGSCRGIHGLWEVQASFGGHP